MTDRLEILTKLFAGIDEILEEEDVMPFQEGLCRLGEMDPPTYVDYLARRDQRVTGQTKKAIRLLLFDRVEAILSAGNDRLVPEIEDRITRCRQHFLNEKIIDQMGLVNTKEDRDFFLKTLILINFLEYIDMEAGWILRETIEGGFSNIQESPAQLLTGKRLLFTNKTWNFLSDELEAWDWEE